MQSYYFDERLVNLGNAMAAGTGPTWRPNRTAQGYSPAGFGQDASVMPQVSQASVKPFLVLGGIAAAVWYFCIRKGK